MRLSRTIGLCAAAVVGVQGAWGAGMGWRGDGTGRYPDARPPTHWSPVSNVLWKTELPARGNATPVLAGGRIYVGAEPTDVICLDAADGRVLWRASNTYFDELPPAEAEAARQEAQKAAALRAELGKLEERRKALQRQIDALAAARARLPELEREAALFADPPALAARIAELQGKAAETEAAPTGRRRERRGAVAETPAERLKLLRDESLLKAEIAKARDTLARDEPREAEWRREAEELQRQAEDLRTRQLAPLTRYELPPTHEANGYSTDTVVSDGEHVFVLRGNGMAACYTLDGERRWLRRVGRPTEGWGQSASPVLAGGFLVVQMEGLAALDRKTGATVWTAPAARARWGTPVVATVGGEEIIITPNGDFVRAADGKLLAEKLAKLDYNAPILHDGVVYFIEQGGKAFRLPETAAKPFQPQTLWTAATIPGDRYYASPVWVDGLIYAINRKSELTAIDAQSGEPVYTRRLDLEATVYSSLTLAGRYLYASGEKGLTVVFEPGREYNEVARNRLEPFRSCPVFRDNRLYIRGAQHLYCIAEAAP